MEIWIILDGEKTGPLHDFEIRRKIESGELQSTTPAWHEGLPTWMPLGKIDLFEREFNRPAAPPAPPEAETDEFPERPAPPPLPPQPHLVRRFWARWFDLYLYSGLWWFALWALGRDIGATLESPWVMLFHYIPWFALEAVLIQRFATTPGKWLLGIRVVNGNGSNLDLAESMRRASRVMFIGIGFGWGILALICQLMAFFSTRRIGKPLWDHAGGHHLEVRPLSPARIAGYVMVLFAALLMQTYVLLPYLLEQTAKTNPEFRQQYEKLREELHRGGRH